MNTDDDKSNKTTIIVITVITLLILLGWGIYLIYANSNEKWPFTPYEPPTVSPETHLYWLNGEGGNELITDEAVLAKRKAMLDQAIIDSRLASSYDYNTNSNYAKTGGTSTTIVYNK